MATLAATRWVYDFTDGARDMRALLGVGHLVRMGAWLGRKTKQSLKLGVCGEHAGDPDSIDFFHHSGIDYVSCSPFRVPVARVAAAQAARVI